jgi:Fe-S cluster assembly ATP-binding protein
MGKNGGGKSTLSQVLAGRETYEVTDGTVLFDGKDMLALSAEERAREGLFLAFQYPVEIPGVSTSYFLKAAVNAVRKHRGNSELDSAAFMKLVREKMALLQMDQSFMNRAVNEGFSGGEKKRNEVFQMAVMDPRLCVMDETDSGLDIDALKVVAGGANKLRNSERGFLVVTHYQRLLNYIEPDFVHVMIDGRIVMTRDKSLAFELESRRESTTGKPCFSGMSNDATARSVSSEFRPSRTGAERVVAPVVGDLVAKRRKPVLCGWVPVPVRRRLALHQHRAHRQNGL